VPAGFGRVFRDIITGRGVARVVNRAGGDRWVRHAVRIRVPSDVFFVPGPQPWALADEDMDPTALNILAPMSWRRASDLDLYVVEWADRRGGRMSKRGVEIIRSSARWSTRGLGRQLRAKFGITVMQLIQRPSASSRRSLVCRTGACEASRSAKRMASSGW
jgi:hypothetical protein